MVGVTVVRPAGHTPEMLAAWEAYYGPKPFTDLLRELWPPYRRLPSGVLYRDRRTANAAAEQRAGAALWG